MEVKPLHAIPPVLGLGSKGFTYKTMKESQAQRCRRTDGKRWQCSRDVVLNQKYCERHMHRGRKRSRKHVEFSHLDCLVLKSDNEQVHSTAPFTITTPASSLTPVVESYITDETTTPITAAKNLMNNNDDRSSYKSNRNTNSKNGDSDASTMITDAITIANNNDDKSSNKSINSKNGNTNATTLITDETTLITAVENLVNNNDDISSHNSNRNTNSKNGNTGASTMITDANNIANNNAHKSSEKSSNSKKGNTNATTLITAVKNIVNNKDDKSSNNSNKRSNNSNKRSSNTKNGNTAASKGNLSHGLEFSTDTVSQVLGSCGFSSNSSETASEQGRCKRTDGKKWQCRKDVLPGKKYCTRHMHRGAKKHVQAVIAVSLSNKLEA